ncbi:MAG: VacJ family lipoprotein [Proteobacteria bacterium]|nr:VacJ family lipoprotein [Pseudomonadota bacterium]
MNKTVFLPLFVLISFALVGCSQQTADPPATPTGNQSESNSQGVEEPGSENVEDGDLATEEDGFDDEEDGDEEGDDDFGDFEDEFAGADEEVWDPLGGYNRFMTGVNDKIYVWVLDPVARGYRWMLPKGVRRGVDRFFVNLLYPVRAVNNIFQLKFKNAGEETLRFATNTTIGIFGIWDPAKEWFGLEAHDEDFGQTLGYWGVGGGPHIVLPILGPSNLRDVFADYPDYVYLDPKSRVPGTERQIALKAIDTVNWTSLHIGEYESVKKDAVDFYPFLRDLYEQNRKKKIEE